MVFSNKEAKEKWCPFTMVSFEGRPIGNRSAGDLPLAGSKCIANDCMMWRLLGDGSDRGVCGIANIPEKDLEAFLS